MKHCDIKVGHAMAFGIEGATDEFYKCIDFLAENSVRKYPERGEWSNYTYYAIALQWVGKEKELLERVEQLKKE
jgi:hypothetical protein